jgi:hypothetical protein
MLTDLFDTSMVIADIQIDIRNRLPIKGDDESHQPVGPHMLGAYI